SHPTATTNTAAPANNPTARTTLTCTPPPPRSADDRRVRVHGDKRAGRRPAFPDRFAAGQLFGRNRSTAPIPTVTMPTRRRLPGGRRPIVRVWPSLLLTPGFRREHSPRCGHGCVVEGRALHDPAEAAKRRAAQRWVGALSERRGPVTAVLCVPDHNFGPRRCGRAGTERPKRRRPSRPAAHQGGRRAQWRNRSNSWTASSSVSRVIPATACS